VKNPLAKFDKAFEHKTRLHIMSVLMVNEHYEFNALKELLQVTDGNLATQIKALEKEEYIEIIKGYTGKKPNTKYKATKLGKAAFNKHLQALENIINMQK
jgi:DNA-binding MarR family transcriptional regulator